MYQIPLERLFLKKRVLKKNLNVYLKQKLFLNQSLQKNLHESLKKQYPHFFNLFNSLFLTLFFLLQENLHFILTSHEKTASSIKKNPFFKKKGGKFKGLNI